MKEPEQAIDPAVRAFHQVVTDGTVADIERALRDSGVDVNAQGRLGQTALMQAIAVKDAAKMHCLLDRGADPELADDFNQTALGCAVSYDFAEGVRLLVARGVDRGYAPRYALKPIDYAAIWKHCEQTIDPVWREVMASAQELVQEMGHHPEPEPVIRNVLSVDVLKVLLDAGDDLNLAPHDVKRAYVGLDTPESPSFTATQAEYREARTRVFGRANPERMEVPFWNDMIRLGCYAYAARQQFGDEDICGGEGPAWCFDRFGSTITPLPDGRFVQIAGEHEDYYDPDFCIYNDVVVHDGQGGFELYGYPEDVFPPTDFHTATLVDDGIYIVGSLGYVETRELGVTPVYRLQVDTWAIEPVATTGQPPSRLHQHRACYDAAQGVLTLEGGKVEVALPDGGRDIVSNDRVYRLDLAAGAWNTGDERFG